MYVSTIGFVILCHHIANCKSALPIPSRLVEDCVGHVLAMFRGKKTSGTSASQLVLTVQAQVGKSNRHGQSIFRCCNGYFAEQLGAP